MAVTMIHNHIVKRKDGWYLLSVKDPGKVLGGPYPSRGGAEKREAQVEYFKKRKK